MTNTQRRRKPVQRTLSEIFTEEFDKWEGSYADIARHVSNELGLPISDQAIGDYHKGAIKKRPNLVVIAAIAEFYGLKAQDLPADIVGVLQQASGVLSGLVGSGTPPGTRTRNLQNAGVRKRHVTSGSVPQVDQVAAAA